MVGASAITAINNMRHCDSGGCEVTTWAAIILLAIGVLVMAVTIYRYYKR